MGSMIRVPDEASLSEVHQLIAMSVRALAQLGVDASPLAIERTAFIVHEAMTGEARAFHTHAHVLEVVDETDPIMTIAGAFHDVVYVQVDRGVVGPLAKLLEPLFTGTAPNFRIAEAAAADPTAALVLAVFGMGTGHELSPFSGLNEFASALVAAKTLEPVLSRSKLAEIAACIEATVPFRTNGAPEGLYERLRALELPDLNSEGCENAVRRAVRLANRDVGNFGSPDPAFFLYNTWQLLPESNPALQVHSTYTNGALRIGLQKTEGFLSGLGAERVFHSFRGEPSPEEYTRLVENARRNISLAVRYLRVKLYTMTVAETLAAATGGDGPIEFFFGVQSKASKAPALALARFLPERPAHEAEDLDPVLLRLIEEGRGSAETPVLLPPSPHSAFMYRSLGDRAIFPRLEQARQFWRGEIDAENWLRSQASPAVATFARAMAHVAFTRRTALEKIAAELEVVP